MWIGGHTHTHTHTHTWSSFIPSMEFLASPIWFKSILVEVAKPGVMVPGVMPPGKGVFKPLYFYNSRHTHTAQK